VLVDVVFVPVVVVVFVSLGEVVFVGGPNTQMKIPNLSE